MNSPLTTTPLFHLGPVPISEAVAVTWGIMAVLGVGSFVAARKLSVAPSSLQSVMEMLVEAVDSQIRDTMAAEPGPYRAFIGTLFVYVFIANWCTLIPGVEPPTAHIETDAALAALVFFAIIWFGIRAAGLRGYLASFAAPSPIMIPINIVESLSRIFSMMVRLFGNVMSGVFMVAIVLSLAGLLVPLPLMALDLLTGAIQAYIFAILAAVFISGVVNEGK
jgi:F-type H+-transporting ATPase subunit a